MRKRKGALPAAGTTHAKARRRRNMKPSEHRGARVTLRCHILKDLISQNSEVIGNHWKVLISGVTMITLMHVAWENHGNPHLGLFPFLHSFWQKFSLSTYCAHSLTQGAWDQRPVSMGAWGDQRWAAVTGLHLHVPSPVTWKRLYAKCQMCTCWLTLSHESLWKNNWLYSFS